MRDRLRKNGYFLPGIVVGPSGFGPDVDSSVNTNERETDRLGVPCHASDDNYTGLQNAFLSRTFGDLPAPAGVYPWIL